MAAIPDKATKEEYVSLVDAFPLVSIQNDAHLDEAIAVLHRLLDQPTRTAAEEAYLMALTDLVERYENAHVVIPPVSGVDALRYLMEENGLTQADLVPLFGTPSIVSEVLSGKRRLSLSHIQRLSAHFGLPADVFLAPAQPPTAPSLPSGTRELHATFARVLSGEQPLGWSEWAMPMDESAWLTPAGHHVAQWAVGVLRRFLGAGFLQQAAEAKTGHPLLSLAGWPGMNPVPWVYANFFQLVAQLALLGDRSKPIRKGMQRSFEPASWDHTLVQLEIAGLGLRDGWQITLEPRLDDRHHADVLLEKDGQQLMVEVTNMSLSVVEREALEFFQGLSMRILVIEMQYHVHLSGSLGEPTSPDALAGWLRQVDKAAAATAHDGQPRHVQGSHGASVQIMREIPEGQTVTLQGAPISSYIAGRIVARIRDKDDQAAGSEAPVWLRLEDDAGLWQFTSLHALPLQDKLTSLAPWFRDALATCRNLAGIILAPSVLWASTPAEQVAFQFRDSAVGVAALRTPLPGHRCRESIIVSRSGPFTPADEALVDWYANETTWLDWALAQLGSPPLDALVREPLIAGDH